ncbi:MAG: hypothetical protein IKM62_01525 [Kiritimatiellae bacterium]|nr:hypothetical protein [Kiritimatiellia bacterium]
MKLLPLCTLLLGLGTFLTGCAGYQRGAAVPEPFRTVHVPAFENRTEYPMVGAIATQQFADALIEDGIFTLEDYDTARLKLQVVIQRCQTNSVRYDRNNVIVPNEYYLTLKATVYIYDAQTGEVYVDGKTLSATETMLTRNQYQTGVQDVLPRVSRKLAKVILDELHAIQ